MSSRDISRDINLEIDTSDQGTFAQNNDMLTTKEILMKEVDHPRYPRNTPRSGVNRGENASTVPRLMTDGRKTSSLLFLLSGLLSMKA